jgi:hypothetical protein
LCSLLFGLLQVEGIAKATIAVGLGPGFGTRSDALESAQMNLGALSLDSSASNFVFGTVSGNFQVFCNFSSQSDLSSVASTVASIVSNLKETGGKCREKLVRERGAGSGDFISKFFGILTTMERQTYYRGL